MTYPLNPAQTKSDKAVNEYRTKNFKQFEENTAGCLNEQNRTKNQFAFELSSAIENNGTTNQTNRTESISNLVGLHLLTPETSYNMQE